MDAHPLTTPNNILTNALNATLITFNGNEFILQNDMGNGRVETAFLPSGYVPVGVKEYGGIIYVASVNPITGKSQLGSFPSPQRNIPNDDSMPSIRLQDSTFGVNEFKDRGYSTTLNNSIAFGDVVFHPGDEFSISLIALSNNISQPE